jgi:Flp pilus assembly pilin Flp
MKKGQRREAMERIKTFLKEEEGVTAIEYALIAVVITLGILLSVQGVRDWIVTQFTAVAGITP